MTPETQKVIEDVLAAYKKGIKDGMEMAKEMVPRSTPIASLQHTILPLLPWWYYCDAVIAGLDCVAFTDDTKE